MQNHRTAVPVKLSGGRTVFASVETQDREEDVALLKYQLTDVTETLHGLVEDFTKSLAKIRCQKVCLDLGVDITVKEGKLVSMVAGASGKAAINVRIEFSPAENNELPK